MKTNEKEVFIGELQQFSEAGGNTKKSKKHFRRSKYLGIPASWFAVLIAATVISSAALIGLIWQTYNLDITGTITINGAEEEPITIKYDGVLLTGTSMTITTMDYTELDPGDELTATHTWTNVDGHGFWIDYDWSGMPCHETSDPESLWYGFEIFFYEHGTTTPIETPFYLDPYTDVLVDYYYDVDGMFADPLVDFPFDLAINIEVYDPPVAEDDAYTITVLETDLSVLLNDFVGDGVTITAVNDDLLPAGAGVTIKPGAQTLHLYCSVHLAGATFTYTISDGFTTSTATVTLSTTF